MAELLAGETSFVVETKEDLTAEMSKLRDQISYTGKIDLELFEELSKAGREFLMSLLGFNPDERLMAAEALQQVLCFGQSAAPWLWASVRLISLN